MWCSNSSYQRFHQLELGVGQMLMQGLPAAISLLSDLVTALKKEHFGKRSILGKLWDVSHHRRTEAQMSLMWLSAV